MGAARPKRARSPSTTKSILAETWKPPPDQPRGYQVELNISQDYSRRRGGGRERVLPSSQPDHRRQGGGTRDREQDGNGEETVERRALREGSWDLNYPIRVLGRPVCGPTAVTACPGRGTQGALKGCLRLALKRFPESRASSSNGPRLASNNSPIDSWTVDYVNDSSDISGLSK